MHETLPYLQPSDFPAISRRELETLQINIGLRCNLACLHCHTNSNRHRREAMNDTTLDSVVALLERRNIPNLDITGGAPELHPGFRDLVVRARALGVHVIDRCNLTVLEEPGFEDLAEFLAGQGVEIIASLPCYTEENVDSQRGRGVFQGSIRALQRLNALGYGRPGSELALNLVYNPLGPSLPPGQEQLEQEYKDRLHDGYGIEFHHLYTLCNMPIKRFGSTLISHGQFDDYMQTLKEAHNDANLERVMCRNLISVDWRGYVYDCDFNQMLGLNIQARDGGRLHLDDLLDSDPSGMPIKVCNHCYGCTAGQGSSCGGALT
ncbi:MAG: arsenosugar biosynthesis radical SAM protein ArsS [Gammaproteobacteria bacterium]|jgi:radical SAM/Cys-rich protein